MSWSPARLRLLLALVIADLLLWLAVSEADAAAPAPHGARVVAEEKAGDRLVDLTIESPALGRTAKVRLLTPDGWEERRSGESWPTLYLLVGGDGTAGVLDPPGTEPDPEIPGLEDLADPFPEDAISPTETLMQRESRTLATPGRCGNLDLALDYGWSQREWGFRSAPISYLTPLSSGSVRGPCLI